VYEPYYCTHARCWYAHSHHIYISCVVCSPFWDIVVITGGDEEQARSYELQLNEKLSNKEIPLCTKYVQYHTCELVDLTQSL